MNNLVIVGWVVDGVHSDPGAAKVGINLIRNFWTLCQYLLAQFWVLGHPNNQMKVSWNVFRVVIVIFRPVLVIFWSTGTKCGQN